MSKTYNIGIDLGTSTVTVSVYENGRIRTIPVDSGMKSMPACVYLDNNAPAVGRMAQLKQKDEPKRVIYDAKRLLGCKYNDPQLKALLPELFYNVERTEKGNIEISVKEDEGAQRFSPSEVVAYLISQAVKNASAYLRGKIGEAVITVPAYYDNVQRNDTLYAGKIAGIDTVHLISDPTAAAISYGLINTIKDETVLVFDFGGGSMDVSILNIRNKTYSVISSSGNSHLGGEDVTMNLLKVVERAFASATNEDISKSARDQIQLYEAVEQAKIALSSVEEYDIDLESLMGHEFHFTVTRSMLENANHDLFAACLDAVEECLKKAYLPKEQVNHVILVGGSSNIPFVRNHITEMFGKERVWSCMNASEVVSQGAAVVAGISHDVVEKGFDFQVAMYTTTHNFGNDDSEMAQLLVNDMTPMNLGIRVSSGRLSPIIEASSSIPCTMRKQYQAHNDNQTSLRFRIFQGLAEMADDCKLINEIVVPIETPGPAAETRVEVSFSLDSNSTLFVEATELKTMKSVSRVMDMGSQVLTKEEVMEMRDSLHQSMVKVDEAEKAAVERNAMTKYIVQVQRKLESEPDGSDNREKKNILLEYRAWLEDGSFYSKEEIKQKFDEIKARLSDDCCVCWERRSSRKFKREAESPRFSRKDLSIAIQS